LLRRFAGAALVAAPLMGRSVLLQDNAKNARARACRARKPRARQQNRSHAGV